MPARLQDGVARDRWGNLISPSEGSGSSLPRSSPAWATARCSGDRRTHSAAVVGNSEIAYRVFYVRGVGRARGAEPSAAWRCTHDPGARHSRADVQVRGPVQHVTDHAARPSRVEGVSGNVATRARTGHSAAHRVEGRTPNRCRYPSRQASPASLRGARWGQMGRHAIGLVVLPDEAEVRRWAENAERAG